jgi:hypothetical protein
MQPDREAINRTPRWVKVLGAIAVVVFLLFLGQLLVGGGRHGPSRHALPEAGR